MAYPMARMPTFREFVDRVCRDFGGYINHLDVDDKVPGLNCTLRWLQRALPSGGIAHCLLPLPETDDDQMTPDLLRNYVSQLKLDPKAFGLDLD